MMGIDGAKSRIFELMKRIRQKEQMKRAFSHDLASVRNVPAQCGNGGASVGVVSAPFASRFFCCCFVLMHCVVAAARSQHGARLVYNGRAQSSRRDERCRPSNGGGGGGGGGGWRTRPVGGWANERRKMRA